MADNKVQQQQFDWSKDSGECVEGVKFDLGVPYEFTLADFQKHNVIRKDGSVVVYSKGRNAGQPMLKYTAFWKEDQTGVEFRTSFFVQDSYRVNENAPETEDDFVRFSRKLGYNPVLGGKFAPADFIHLGTKITAELMEREQSEADKKAGKKAYSEINIETITLAGENATDSQADLPEEIPEEIITKLQRLIDAAPKCKKFPELAAKINKAGAKDKSMFELLEPAMRASEQKLLKFA